MAKISRDQVRHVAHLARLYVTDEEAEVMTKHLSEVINYAEQLNELDTENVEPTSHVLDMKNVMRKDEPKEWIKKEDALKNAPDHKEGQFRVPSILE